MNNLATVKKHLALFIKKYYVNQLIKGSILFATIGLLYLMVTLFVEYIFWLSIPVRTFLFWLLILGLFVLFVYYICIPLAYLFKIKNGLSFEEASKIIGQHFSSVDDTLLNVLQLEKTSDKSELLLASIEQKSEKLSPIPFGNAINFKVNTKYLKFLAIPIAILLISLFFGTINWFTDSYDRMVNYQTHFSKPSPFQLLITNTSLTVEEGSSFTLQVEAAGTMLPEQVLLKNANGNFYLKRLDNSHFSYRFDHVENDFEFQLVSNDFTSQSYNLKVVKAPMILSYQMLLKYPNYIGKQDEVIKNTTDVTVFEGTKIEWKLHTNATDSIAVAYNDSIYSFSEKDDYHFNEYFYKKSDVSFTTSNKNFNNYEKLNFSIAVVKDQFPSIEVQQFIDSTQQNFHFLNGKVSDDYGLSTIELVYYPAQNPNQIKKVIISKPQNSVATFVHVFPDTISLVAGAYEYYYQAKDNDAVHGGKISKSKVFTYRSLTNQEEESLQLKEQKSTIDAIDNALKNNKKDQKQLDQLSQFQKEKSSLSYSDKQKFNQFLQQDQQQQKQLQQLSESLKENLDDFAKKNELQKEDKYLQERLERLQNELKKQEELNKKIQEQLDKLSPEELSKSLEDLQKSKNQNQRSSEQLLELAKRFYVEQKYESLKNQINNLAKKQEDLSNSDSNTSDQQEELNQDFKDFQEDMNTLEKDNNKLKSPLDLNRKENQEKDIANDQKQAKEKLENSEEAKENNDSKNQDKQASDAKQKQQDAAKKMKSLGANMQQQQQASGGEMLDEDINTLRQIIDNLLVFSKRQEDLMVGIERKNSESVGLSKSLITQQEYKTLFQHVDDSLFALSLRQPMISDKINPEIESVYYSIDQALDRFAENQIYQGLSSQQYTLTAVNNLANLLSDFLNSMQQMAIGQGQGKGSNSQGFQLQDIIMDQQQLSEQMKSGSKKGQQKGNKPGDKNKGDSPGDKQGEGQGNTPSQDGVNGSTGNGNGFGESEAEQQQLYEIFKEQQRLRDALEKQLNDVNMSSEGKIAGKQTLQQMDKLLDELLENGITESIYDKMLHVEHQLLKLENAAFSKEQKSERESKTNDKSFDVSNTALEHAKQYFKQYEILNRQVLPLQQFYKNKVNTYFKKDD